MIGLAVRTGESLRRWNLAAMTDRAFNAMMITSIVSNAVVFGAAGGLVGYFIFGRCM